MDAPDAVGRVVAVPQPVPPRPAQPVLPPPARPVLPRPVAPDVCAMLGDVENRSVSPEFVGRAEELASLVDALARAGAGEPQALLIGGEAGVGKTRLVEEFLAAAGRREAVVAVGGCVEIGADGLPFAPFSTALRALRRTLPGEMASACAGQEGELARLLPELGEADRDATDEHSTARLFELTARLLERISTDRTVVLVLEDLHWADASTRHLLAYLFRTLRNGRLVVIGTYRADDIHRRHPLRPLLAELDRLRTVRRIELPRFSHAEVRRQLTGILAVTPEAALVDDIFERSDGNAFFVEELARSLECCGDSSGLSDSLRDLLLVRVEALSDDAQKVARIVAEGGSTVEHELLAAVAGLAEDELNEALRAAVGANLLRPAPDSDGYRFRHSLVREAVSDDLLPGERSRLNRRYAKALEADPALVRADERATRLASYWYAAHDAAKALPAVLKAAVEARRRFAHSEQLRLLERAMELWDDVPDDVRRTLRPLDYAEVYPACGCDPETTPLRYLDLMAEATVAARFGGDRERALAISKKAMRVLDAEGDPLRAAWFWVQRSRLMQDLTRGDGWQELAIAQDLVRGLPRPPCTPTSSPTWRAGEPCTVRGRRRSPTPTGRWSTPGSSGTSTSNCTHVSPGVAHRRRGRGRRGPGRDVRRPGPRRRTAPGPPGGPRQHQPPLLAGVHGPLPGSRGRRRPRHRGLPQPRHRRHGGMGPLQPVPVLLLARVLGREPGGRRRGGPARPVPQVRGLVATRRTELAIARGDLVEAEQQLALARRLFGPHDPQPQHLITPVRHAMYIAARQGRLAEARAAFEALAERGFPPGTQRYALPLLHVAAAVEADARGLPATDPGRPAALERIRGHLKRLPMLIPVWAAHGVLVEAELARAEGADTPGHWSRAAEAFAPLHRPYELAQIRHRWAEALLIAPGDRTAVTALLREAHAVAHRLGAKPLAETVEQLAGRARITLDAPDRARPGAVGPRSTPRSWSRPPRAVPGGTAASAPSAPGGRAPRNRTRRWRPSSRSG